MSLANSIVSDIDALDRFADQLTIAGQGYADQTPELWQCCAQASDALMKARAAMLVALEKTLMQTEFPMVSKLQPITTKASDDFMPHIEQAQQHLAACKPPEYDFIILSIKEDFESRIARIKSLKEMPEECVSPLIAHPDLTLAWCMSHVWSDR